MTNSHIPGINVPDHNEADEPVDLEHLWQFAGQGLRSSDFNTAMVHFYRGELARSNTWRSRLDITTNWAVITTGAALSFAFGSATNTPLVLIINTFLVLFFLFIEARRYRYYELWTSRVRIMEREFFGALLSPPFLPHAEWADKLTASLNTPRFPIGLAEAFGRRYRRNYFPLFLILAISWVVKIIIHPTPINTVDAFMERASVGPLSGWAILLAGFVFNGVLMAVGFGTVGLRQSQGEVLAAENPVETARTWLRRLTWDAFEIELPHLTLREQNQLVYIITDRVEEVSAQLMRDLKRGVTLLQGTGMYTGKAHGVMFSVISARQLNALKRSVRTADPAAFVIVTPLHSVHGGGFRPLEA